MVLCEVLKEPHGQLCEEQRDLQSPNHCQGLDEEALLVFGRTRIML